MTNKKHAELSTEAKSHLLRAVAGVGGGATAGYLLDSENPTRGALAGGAVAGLIHAPHYIRKAFPEPERQLTQSERLGKSISGTLNRAYDQAVLENPKTFATGSALTGAALGGGAVGLADYVHLRNKRHDDAVISSVKTATFKYAMYVEGSAAARARLGL